jgi:hypothetical protein
LATQGRLRHIQTLGGTTKMQFLGEGDKATELADFKHEGFR